MRKLGYCCWDVLKLSAICTRIQLAQGFCKSTVYLAREVLRNKLWMDPVSSTVTSGVSCPCAQSPVLEARLLMVQMGSMALPLWQTSVVGCNGAGKIVIVVVPDTCIQCYSCSSKTAAWSAICSGWSPLIDLTDGSEYG